MIKPWIFEFFGAPIEFHEKFDAPKSARYFDAYLDLWASAEPAGFEGIFFSEHHFGAAYSPAPNLLIANGATRTRTLPLCQCRMGARSATGRRHWKSIIAFRARIDGWASR